MGFNIEIKARVNDLARLGPLLLELGARLRGLLVQEDVYFNSPKGRLKIRRTNQEPPELILYERGDQIGPKGSDYRRWKLKDPEQMHEVLTSLLGQRGVVRKERTLYILERTRIHLDRVQGLGSFLELEVVLDDPGQSVKGETTARDLLRRLGIEQEHLIRGSYIDLIAESEGGKPA